MSFKDELYSYLSAYTGLTTYVGTRIYSVKAPQNVQVPYCAYYIISDIRDYSHQGYSHLRRIRVQISCFSNETVELESIKEQVIAAIEAWPTVNANVQAAFIEDGPDLYEDETQRYHIPVDAIIWYGD
jgi:hypothetical protein